MTVTVQGRKIMYSNETHTQSILETRKKGGGGEEAKEKKNTRKKTKTQPHVVQ